MTWRDELLDELKKRWLAGESASEISSALLTHFHVAFSRNAIMGKLYRLGMTNKRSRTPKIDSGQQPSVVKPRQTLTVRLGQRRYDRPKLVKLPSRAVMRPKSPTLATAQFLKALASERRPCSLLELTTHACRWPIGDLSTNDFGFCGIPEADMTINRPYCKVHTQMSAGNG